MTDTVEERYPVGRVYKLTGSDGYYYHGSTTKPMRERINNHKSSHRSRVSRHFGTLGWEHVTVEVISTHHDITRDELRAFEDACIRPTLGDDFCLNRLAAVQDVEENRLSSNAGRVQRYWGNVEEERQYHKQYYEKNAEQLKEEARQYRKKLAQGRLIGDEAALAQRAKESIRKGKSIICRICDTQVTYGNIPHHRATDRCVEVQRRYLKTALEIKDTLPDQLQEAVDQLRTSLEHNEAQLAKNKIREAVRVSTCKACGETVKHVNMKTHKRNCEKLALKA